MRLPAAAVALALATAHLTAGSIATAGAKECRPSSAERAFEELLDVAPDGSPVETEAWQIADETEAKGTFETDRTRDRLDDVARQNGYRYHCPSRSYRAVQGPDPREAVESEDGSGDDPEPAPGDTTPGAVTGKPAPAGAQRPGSPTGTSGGSTAGLPAPDGTAPTSGRSPTPGLASEGGQPDSPAVGTGTGEGVGTSVSGTGGRAVRGNGAGDARDDAESTEVAQPGPVADAGGGIADLPGEPGRSFPAAGLGALALGVAAMAAAVRVGRRRQAEPLT